VFIVTVKAKTKREERFVQTTVLVLFDRLTSGILAPVLSVAVGDVIVNVKKKKKRTKKRERE
jgi:hypothetical protein